MYNQRERLKLGILNKLLDLLAAFGIGCVESWSDHV